MNRIKQLREEKHMTQVRLSIELEVSQEMVSQYERGMNMPSVRNLLKMSEIFGASCDYILGLSDVKRIVSVKDYTAEEIEMIADYRALSPTQRAMARGYVKGVSDGKIK